MRDDARLMVAAMPFPCRPLMYDAASFPVRNGSSENDSKFRPPRGPRCRQTVGANRTCADLALVSSAKCSPTSCRSFLSHVAASDTPHGKRAAYISMSVDQQRLKVKQSYTCSSFEDCTASTIWSIRRFDVGYAFRRDSYRSPVICCPQEGYL
jgi:hypothetical protein